MLLFWSASLTLMISIVWTITEAVPIPWAQVDVEAYGGDKYVCLTDDILYRDGDIVTTTIPCNTCACQAPHIVCAPVLCEKNPGCRALQRPNQCCPEYQCECERDGQIFSNGETLESKDPCEVCYCRGGVVICTLLTCYVRDDCKPQEVPGRCCPKYDHCPLQEDRITNHLPTIRPSILTTSFRSLTSSLAGESTSQSRHPSSLANTENTILSEVTTDTRSHLLGELQEAATTTLAPEDVQIKVSMVTKRHNDNQEEKKIRTTPLTASKTDVETGEVAAASDTGNVETRQPDMPDDMEDMSVHDSVAESSEHAPVQALQLPETSLSDFEKETSSSESFDNVMFGSLDRHQYNRTEEIDNASRTAMLPEGPAKDTTPTPTQDIEASTNIDGLLELNNGTSEDADHETSTNSANVLTTTGTQEGTTQASTTTYTSASSESWEHHRPTQMVTDDIQYVTTEDPISSSPSTTIGTSTVDELEELDVMLGETGNQTEATTIDRMDTDIANETDLVDEPSQTESTLLDDEESNTITRFQKLGEADEDLNYGTDQTWKETETEIAEQSTVETTETEINSTSIESTVTREDVQESVTDLSEPTTPNPIVLTTIVPGIEGLKLEIELPKDFPENERLPVLKLSQEMAHHQMDFVIHHIEVPAESEDDDEVSGDDGQQKDSALLLFKGDDPVTTTETTTINSTEEVEETSAGISSNETSSDEDTAALLETGIVEVGLEQALLASTSEDSLSALTTERTATTDATTIVDAETSSGVADIKGTTAEALVEEIDGVSESESMERQGMTKRSTDKAISDEATSTPMEEQTVKEVTSKESLEDVNATNTISNIEVGESSSVNSADETTVEPSGRETTSELDEAVTAITPEDIKERLTEGSVSDLSSTDKGEVKDVTSTTTETSDTVDDRHDGTAESIIETNNGAAAFEDDRFTGIDITEDESFVRLNITEDNADVINNGTDVSEDGSDSGTDEALTERDADGFRDRITEDDVDVMNNGTDASDDGENSTTNDSINATMESIVTSTEEMNNGTESMEDVGNSESDNTEDERFSRTHESVTEEQANGARSSIIVEETEERNNGTETLVDERSSRSDESITGTKDSYIADITEDGRNSGSDDNFTGTAESITENETDDRNNATQESTNEERSTFVNEEANDTQTGSPEIFQATVQLTETPLRDDDNVTIVFTITGNTTEDATDNANTEAAAIDRIIRANEEFDSKKTTPVDSEGTEYVSQHPREQLSGNPAEGGLTTTAPESGITDNLDWVHLLGEKQDTERADNLEDKANAIENSTLILTRDATFVESTSVTHLSVDQASTPDEAKGHVELDVDHDAERSQSFQVPTSISQENVSAELQPKDAQEIGKYDLALLQNFFKNHLYIQDDNAKVAVT